MKLLCFFAALLMALPMSSAHGQSALISSVPTKEWVLVTLPDIFGFTPESYKEIKKQNKTYFTRDGYKAFYEGMERAQLDKYPSNIIKICPLDSARNDDGRWQVQAIVVFDIDGRKNYHDATILLEENKDTLKLSQYIAAVPDSARIALCAPEDTEDKLEKLEQEKQALQMQLEMIQTQIDTLKE